MPRSQLLETAGFNQLVAARDGYFLYNRNDLCIGRALEKYGEFSGLEMELLRQICGPGNVVIEVGANIGAHTVGLARRVGVRGHVLAFEPQRLVFQTLCANVALNSLENVECRWAAVGSEDGYITVPDLSPHQEVNFGGPHTGRRAVGPAGPVYHPRPFHHFAVGAVCLGTRLPAPVRGVVTAHAVANLAAESAHGDNVCRSC
jgi:hypothetical protein